MSRQLQIIRYLGAFVLARGVLFLAPLALANLLTPVDYARIEWAYANGAILATFLTLGTASVVPIVLLSPNTRTNATLWGIRAHHIAVAAACLSVTCIGAGHVFVWPLALMCGFISLQGLISIELKTQGHANASLFIDASLFAAMVMSCGLCKWLSPMNMVVAVWIPPVMLMMGMMFKLVRQTTKHQWNVDEWKSSVNAGIPLMLTGLVATLVASSGRAGTGYLMGADQAAVYAVLSRGAALPIIAHQVILVAQFRNVFEIDVQRLERMLIGILLLVALSALIFWAIHPVVGFLLGPAFSEATARQSVLLPWLLAQSILWSAIALNDLINTRYQIAAKVLRWSVPALLIALASGYVAAKANHVSLQRFVQIHGLAMLAFYAIQSMSMWQLGARLPKVWGTAIASYVVLIGLATYHS